jgi:hypothetical protein
MANTTRSRSKALIEQAGLSTKDFQGTWHRARDFNAIDLQKEINHIKRTGKPSIQKAPSDVAKGIREEYRKNFEPKKPRRIGVKFEPPPKAPPKAPPPPPPPPSIPDGRVIVFWLDLTKRGKKTRFPRAYRDLIDNKIIQKKQDPEAILKFIFGQKGNKDLQGYFQENKGAVGDVEIKIYRSEEEKRQLKKEFKGWKVLYDGKGSNRKDLLIALAAVVSGVYNVKFTKDAAGYFIDQIKKIHPANGNWLDELYKKYASKGYDE